MGLLQRVLGTEEPKIAIHAFMAIAEYKRGAVTKNQIVTAFGLSVAEGNALQTFLTNMDSNSIDRDLLHDVLLLGERGYYTESVVRNRLSLG